MRSSYEKNNYGDVFYANIIALRPVNAVELGVLDGYSSFHIARGLRQNAKIPGVKAKLHSYDLWEKYPYKHGVKRDVEEMLGDVGLDEFVEIREGDAYEVHKEYPDDSIHFLHVDISNTGDTVRKIMEAWDPKMMIGGMIIFEGGTEERDQIDWMIKYDAAKIRPELDKNPIIQEHYVMATYLPYPGLTVLLKKR